MKQHYRHDNETTNTFDAHRDDLTAYDDGDAIVLCDRSNPNAWIRLDRTDPICQ